MTQPERRKMWVTKYALTQGVYLQEMQQSPRNNKYFYLVTDDGKASFLTTFVIGKDCHEFHQDAIDRANEIKAKKLKSLRKQIDKIEALDFGAEKAEDHA